MPRGEIRLLADAIHPLWRTHPTPSGHEVDRNPPAFFWPSSRTAFTQPLMHYDFQLSKSPDFSNLEMSISAQNPSFAVPNGPLELGRWYWRYRETGMEWQGPFQFSIDKGSRIDARPSATEFINQITGDRPRMVIRKAMLGADRKKFDQDGTTAALVKSCEQYFNVKLPESEWGGRFYKDGKEVFKGGKFPEDHVKSMITAPVWEGAITKLCKAYLLTNEEKYGREALRWAMRVASFRLLPENNLTYDNNPYPDGFDFAYYLDSMSYVYDSFYDRMTDEERGIIRKNLSERLRIYYEYYCNRLESRCLDNHSWQISLGAFVRAAITARGDVPEADKYLAYAYNIWEARDPEQSRKDGGWFGGGYVGVNIGVWTEVAALFHAYTGYNYYNTPFYHNQPYWFLYRQPPGSQEDGFSGDGYGGGGRGIGEKVGQWLNVLDADLNIPVAGWLANTAPSKKGGVLSWTRQCEGMPMSNPRKASMPEGLPQSRVFRDTGIVNMHRDLMHATNDLHVALRSSPYGTFGHNLASHNAINVIYHGDYLFVPYGQRFGGAKNSAACYRNTRGHNSVLVDGKGQPFSPEAYGWIPRFLDGKEISYACGDASHAYQASSSDREDELFKSAGLNIDDHISSGVLTRFRRHLLFLRPSLIVVYDELEAKKPVEWDWVLHCRKMMEAKGSVLTVNGVNATVDVRGSVPMVAEVKTKPMYPAINVDGRGGEKAGEPYPVIGSYAYVSSSQKVDKLRIVSLIQVGEQHDVREKDGKIECGNWSLQPEMNVIKPANLLVENKNGKAEFLLKDPKTGASVLTEVINGQKTISTAVDELPYDALDLQYSNGTN